MELTPQEINAPASLPPLPAKRGEGRGEGPGFIELSPQEIDAARTAAEIDRQVRRSMLSPKAASALEKRALALHPPIFRVTQPVPASLRQAETQMLKPGTPAPAAPKLPSEGGSSTAARSPKRKKHILP
jgi:hypothetical protein